MKLKTVLTAAVISGILMGCVSVDDCEEMLPPITPPVPPVEQFIALEGTQAKINQAFINAKIEGNTAVETSQIMKEATVLNMKKVEGYTLLHVNSNGLQSIYIAKGNGSKYAKIKDNVADHYQFDKVYFPFTMHNDTQYIVVFDQHDATKVTRFDGDLNPVDQFQIETYDVVNVATNSSPTMHDKYMTIPIYNTATMYTERHIYKYDGKRHQGWRIEDSSFVLGIAGDGDLVYAVRHFDMGREKFRVSYINDEAMVYEIGVVDRKNVNFGDIRDATTYGRYVSLYGNTIDVLNKEILSEPTCSFEPFSGAINVGSTEDYFVCPTDIGVMGAGVMSFERYDAATGERTNIHVSRPAKPTRFSAESVTFTYDDHGVAIYNVDTGLTEVDNAFDIVK